MFHSTEIKSLLYSLSYCDISEKHSCLNHHTQNYSPFTLLQNNSKTLEHLICTPNLPELFNFLIPSSHFLVWAYIIMIVSCSQSFIDYFTFYCCLRFSFAFAFQTSCLLDFLLLLKVKYLEFQLQLMCSWQTLHQIWILYPFLNVFFPAYV